MANRSLIRTIISDGLWIRRDLFLGGRLRWHAGFSQLQQRSTERRMIGVSFAATCSDPIHKVTNRVHQLQQDIRDRTVEDDVSFPQSSQQRFTGVSEPAEAIEVQKTAVPFDGVQRSEDAIEACGVLGISFQLDHFGIELLKSLATLRNEILNEFAQIAHGPAQRPPRAGRSHADRRSNSCRCRRSDIYPDLAVRPVSTVRTARRDQNIARAIAGAGLLRNSSKSALIGKSEMKSFRICPREHVASGKHSTQHE